MRIFEVSREFPKEEKYSLTDQIRRASRSICANIAEAWRKRRYKTAFICKLNDAEAEAAETQTWLQFATKCDFLSNGTEESLYGTYDKIIDELVTMSNNPNPWLLHQAGDRERRGRISK